MRARAIPPGNQQAAGPLVLRQVRGAGIALEGPAGPGDGLQERLVREGYDEGRRQGEAAGRNLAAAEYRAAIERMAQAIGELAGLRARLRREAEADLVQLALAIARRVLRRELAVDPDALRGLVISALEKLRGQEIARVKVHPGQAALLTACLQELAAGAVVEVTPDASREPGAVIFETARGNLDASVEAQLDEIGRGLADCLRKQS
jgi:flagellar assembly protein FliH